MFLSYNGSYFISITIRMELLCWQIAWNEAICHGIHGNLKQFKLPDAVIFKVSIGNVHIGLYHNHCSQGGGLLWIKWNI